MLKQERVDRGELPGLSTKEALDLAAAKRRIKQPEAELAVRRACRVLSVWESGYYDWKGRPAPPSGR